MDGMEDPGANPGAGRRGRHAAPPTGPAGPLSRAVAALGAMTASALAAVSGWIARFRAGPVLPWISAHRMLVLVVGALVVSGAAFTATAAVIAQPPVAESGEPDDDGARPQPGSGFVMPSPVTGSPTPSTAPPTAPATPSAPSPSAPADEAPVDPEPTTDPEPTAEPEPTEESNGNGRPDPPGAENRPDKTKD